MVATVGDLIASRLAATGIDTEVARRLATLMEEDFASCGLAVVDSGKLDFLAKELNALQVSMSLLVKTCLKFEQMYPLPKERR